MTKWIALIPPGIKPFATEPPYEQVNAPVDVFVGGVSAEVVNAFGWPGSLDTYRVDFRVPSGSSAGAASLQVTSAWIQSDAVEIRIQ